MVFYNMIIVLEAYILIDLKHLYMYIYPSS